MPGPLSGVRVVELTSVVLGPVACQISRPWARSDQDRAAARDSNRQLAGAPSGHGCALFHVHRNKRSSRARREAAARARRCLTWAHGRRVHHNNRPQVMTKLGLDYERSRRQPMLIYCGSYATRSAAVRQQGALDDSIQSIAGVAMLNKLVLGERGYLPTIIATRHRDDGGVRRARACSRASATGTPGTRGAMFETMVSYVMADTCGHDLRTAAGAGYVRLMSVHAAVPHEDGYVAILPYMNAHWDTFCDVTGHAELRTIRGSAPWATARATRRHVRRHRADHGTRTTQEWLDLFARPACRSTASTRSRISRPIRTSWPRLLEDTEHRRRPLRTRRSP